MANRMEYLTSIRVDMYNIMKLYDNCFIHRAKCGAIRTDFERFCKETASMLSDKSIVTPAEAQLFKHIIQQVGVIRDLFRDVSEEHYIETILEHEVTYVQYTIYNFKVKFNDLVKQVKLSVSACQMDDEQFKMENEHDMNKLATKIREVINTGNLSNQQKQQLEEKLQEIGDCVSTEDSSARRKAYLDQILSPEEIQAKLAQFKKWELNSSDFVKQKKIGRGGFAEVYLGYHKTTGRVVAIKQLLDDPRTVRDVKVLRREIKILSELRHFAILPFVGVCLSSPYSIITEFMSNGSLYDRLRKGGSALDATKLTIIAMGIAYGMAYIHEKKMLHRDLKSLNVLLDADDFPKICDFGVSRKLPEHENDPLTFNAGTLQYMAPEVLISEHYNEKADVYSYGILLWELFTRNTPYQGMNMLQTAMRVANSNLRPVIPPNCPQPLAEVIRRCWNKDPAKRPTFDDIIKTFTYGKVSFPGTNPTALTNYMTQYLQGYSNIEHFNPDDASKSIANTLYIELGNPEVKLEHAVTKLKMIAEKPLWYPYIISENIIQRIIEVMKVCPEAKIAFNLVYSMYHFLKDEEILNEFVKLEGVSAIVELFLKYGNTSMMYIIDCMVLLVEVEHVVFNTEMFLKLSPFLVANDLTVRRITVELVNAVIERNAYDDEGSLTVIVGNVLANTMPEAMPDLLSVALTLLKKLITLEKPFNAIIRYGGTSNVFALTSHHEKSIQLDALDLIRYMLTETNPSQQTISMFIDGFAKLVMKRDSDIQMTALIVLAVLLKSQATFKEFVVNDQAVRALATLFKSEKKSIATCSLKLCYAFMTCSSSYHAFVMFGNDLLDLILAESTGIQIIAAACLTSLIQRSGVHDLIDDRMKQFLNQSLSEEGCLTHAGLRLSGVISGSMKGAKFLEQTGAMAKIASLLVSESTETKKLAVMVLASHSSSYPMSRAAISSVPVFFDELNNKDLSPYPLIAITNVTVNPQAAVACCSKLDKLLTILDSHDDLDIKRTLTAVHRIVTTRETVGLLKDSPDVITELVTRTEKHWSDEYSTLVFDIMEAIAGIEGGAEILGKSKLPAFIVNQMDNATLGSHTRSLLMRILSRIDYDIV